MSRKQAIERMSPAIAVLSAMDPNAFKTMMSGLVEIHDNALNDLVGASNDTMQKAQGMVLAYRDVLKIFSEAYDVAKKLQENKR